MSSTPIQTLVRALTEEFARDPRGKRAAKLLADYARTEDDWRRYAHFHRDAYTRNLVARTEAFEMLVLCWSRGQTSPIHDHAGQHCWMAVLDGIVEEVQYDRPSRPDARAPLAAHAPRAYERGAVAYIHDDIALHLVRCGPAGQGTSLHLYARPIDTCRVFDPATGAVLERTLLYHSVEGVPTPT
jgi:cysteine dioxygenase